MSWVSVICSIYETPPTGTKGVRRLPNSGSAQYLVYAQHISSSLTVVFVLCLQEVRVPCIKILLIVGFRTRHKGDDAGNVKTLIYLLCYCDMTRRRNGVLRGTRGQKRSILYV